MSRVMEDDERRAFLLEGTRIDELVAVATRIGGRYMGEDRAEEFGRRNGVPGELVVPITPTELTALAAISG